MATAMDRSLTNTNDSGPAVSVVVCTYDRADLLADCLETLCRQTLDHSLYEVIVVDNKPKKETKRVADRFASRGNVRYCPEPRAGLSNARNCGWRAARGRYVAYIDDDCKVPKHWLELATHVAEEVGPAAFGGPYYPFYNTPKPAWYLDRYAAHFQGDQPRALNDNEFLDGMNIVFRKSVLQRLEGFDPHLGMSGETIAYGEETQVLRRIRVAMPEEVIHYEPQLYVHHLVRPEKMTLSWTVRQQFAMGRYTHIVFQGDAPPTVGRKRLLARAMFTSAAVVGAAGRAIVFRNRSRYPFVQNGLYECVFPRLQTLGRIVEQYRRCSRYRRAAPTLAEPA